MRKQPAKRTTGTGTGEKRQPPRTQKEKIFRVAYITLTVISALIVAGYIAFQLFSAPPDPNSIDNPDRPEFTRPPMTTTTRDPITGEEMEVEIPGLSADRKEQFYTFLLVGQDTGGGGNTDTMMLVAYDVPNQTLNVMNIPRDTYVQYGSREVLLNSVYNRAGGDRDGKGISALKREVSELTGVYPDYHVIIQWTALGKLVDAIGGVEFEVPFNMYYNDLSQHFKINLKKGYQLLDGNKAMQLIRYRMNSIGDTGVPDYSYGYAEGDLGRIKTQQAFMKAIIAKCLKPDVLLPNLGNYISIFQENVVTNLSASDMAYFGKSAIGGLEMEDVEFVTMPNKSAGNGHLLPIGSQIVSTINKGYNPYLEDIRLGELKLVTTYFPPSPSETPEGDDPRHDDDPDHSPDPDESGTPRPSGSGSPGDSPEPMESDDVLLPPGMISRPSASPNASGSPRPSGSTSPRPSGSQSPAPSESNSPRPSGSNTPSPSGSVRPSGGPGGSLGTPSPTLEPPATPPPATPAAEEEPVLPPM